jgi:RES domain-containing protein
VTSKASGKSRTFWRSSNHSDLDGWGGRKFSSRWSTAGRRIVYLAESPAGAMLEILVHMEFADAEAPDDYQLLSIDVPDVIEVLELEPSNLDWRESQRSTRRMGDAWLTSRATPLARVPSAIVPRTWNFLLNPEHPHAAQVRIHEMIRERFDNRLFRSRAS